MRAQRFEQRALQLAYDCAYETMELSVARRDRLDAAIAEMAADSEFTPVTDRLGCLRGVSTLTAFALAVEIGDWQRLTGRSIGAYLGLVPTESSSGTRRVQGGLTKTGNGHARRFTMPIDKLAYISVVGVRGRLDELDQHPAGVLGMHEVDP